MRYPRVVLAMFSLVLGLTAGSLGCRTTSTSETEEKAGDAEEEPEAVKHQPGSIALPYELTEGKSRDIYEKMKKTELAAGQDVPKDRLHTSRGLLECKKEGVLKSCFFRVRLKGSTLSDRRKLSRGFSKTMMSRFAKLRPRLEEEDHVLADLVCDYVGRKSPPYDVEKVGCDIIYPRLPGEAILTEAAAEELGEVLAGGRNFSNNRVTLDGTVSCQANVDGGVRTCLVRTIKDGTLLDRVDELPRKASAAISRKLTQAYGDLAKIEAEKEGRDHVGKPPEELMASATCVIESLSTQESLSRRYKCRLGL